MSALSHRQGSEAPAEIDTLDLSEMGRRLEDIAIGLGAWIRRNGPEAHLVALPQSPFEVDALAAARSLRRLIRQRRMRSRFFPPELFADPAWDILLDLAAARLEHTTVPISSLCIASGVPTTTALRWISTLVHLGLLSRRADPVDRRRIFVELTADGWDSMSRYFAMISGAP